VYNRIMHLSRILAPFRRLRWKLTFSYTLATVAAVLALEMVALCALFMLFSRPAVQMDLVHEAAATLAEEVQPYLSATPPDRAGVQFLLRQIIPPQTVSGSAPDIDLDTDLGAPGTQTSLTFGEGDRIAVLSRQGELVAASTELSPANAELATPFADPHATVESRRIIDQALRGEPAATQLPDRTILVAEPVVGEDGHVVGVIYLRIVSFTLLAQNLLGGALGLIGGSALVLTLGAAFVGTLFGFFVAHGFVRRLGALTQATEAWGRGDFAPTVHDTSADEIGQLGRRLNLMAEEIQNLLQARQELAALEERNRLARDLHDSVKQQVFATSMTLGAAESLWERDSEAAREKVAQALALCRQAQQELSGLLHELRPVALADKGLAVALREYVARWWRQTGIEATVAIQEERALEPEVEEALFRVAQEALANAAKHSRARRVQVSLSYPAAAVLLEVTDDGCGFAPPPPAGRGMGLRSMRERVEALGGELTIDSNPGEGTRVTARCQIEPAPEGGERS
jgi:two-component system, NarL family, sensor histidine kinase LiaS